MLGIIIPFYKLTFFEATLQSLAHQTNQLFKVYIGDDASPEDCTTLLSKFEGKFDFVYHRFDKNLGGISLTQQWERCIALSNQEEWIMILGDDDVLEAKAIASFYENKNEINSNECKVIRFASRYIDENQKPLKGYLDYFNPKLEKAEDSFYRNFLGQSRSSLSEHIFLRSTYLKFGFHNYPLAWHSDDRAWLEFTDKKPIYSINDAFVEVRVTAESITGKKDNEALKQKAKIQFYEFIVYYKQLQFTKAQKEHLLLEYGVLIQNQEPFPVKKGFIVFISLIKLARFYNAIRFLRRIIKSQLK